MDGLGLLHTVAATAALISGLLVLVQRKGTRRHRQTGYVYVISMTVMIATALVIFDLFGGWGAFHWAALASGATLAMGFVPALLRRPATDWIEWHYIGMCWSYVGLVAAAMAELLTRLPDFAPQIAERVPGNFFWNMVVLSAVGVCAIGYWLINRRRLGYDLVRRMRDANLATRR